MAGPLILETMEAVTTLPQGRPLTWRDLEDRPDDGHRYELVDGAYVDAGTVSTGRLVV